MASPADPTAAFEKAFATSLYVFDACGDQLTGKMFRQALSAKLAQCHVPGDAMARYHQRTALLFKRQRDRFNKVIDQNGGIPVQVEGMETTCHAQQSSPTYRALVAKLDAFGQGKDTPDSVIPGACDAEEFAP